MSAATSILTQCEKQRDLYDFELEPEVRDWLDSLSDSDFSFGSMGYSGCWRREESNSVGPGEWSAPSFPDGDPIGSSPERMGSSGREETR